MSYASVSTGTKQELNAVSLAQKPQLRIKPEHAWASPSSLFRHRPPGLGGAPTEAGCAADLKAQADWLKEQLDAVQKRIEELASK